MNLHGSSEKHDSSLGKAAKCPARTRWPPALAAAPEGTAASKNKRRQASCLSEGAQEAGGSGVKLIDPKEGVRIQQCPGLWLYSGWAVVPGEEMGIQGE